MIWGGHEVAENAFFLRYGDLDADAHALQVWRTEDHADDEAVYRVGFTLGQDRHYDIAWCGLGHGADPDVLTDVEVWLPRAPSSMMCSIIQPPTARKCAERSSSTRTAL